MRAAKDASQVGEEEKGAEGVGKRFKGGGLGALCPTCGCREDFSRQGKRVYEVYQNPDGLNLKRVGRLGGGSSE